MRQGRSRGRWLLRVVPALAVLISLAAPQGSAAQQQGTVAANCPEPDQRFNWQQNGVGRAQFAGQIFTSRVSGPATHGQALLQKNGAGQRFAMFLQAVDSNGNPSELLGFGTVDDAVVPMGDSMQTFGLDDDDPTDGKDPQLVKGQRYAVSVSQIGVPFDPNLESNLVVYTTEVSLCGSDVPFNGWFYSSFYPPNGGPYPAAPYSFPDPGDSMIFGVFSEPTCQGKPATDLGTSGSDRIVGTKGRDVIATFGGNDTVLGKGGRDIVCGGAGRDLLHGHAGRDVLVGGKGDDRCVEGSGADATRSCGKLNESLTGESCEGKIINSSAHNLVVTARSKKSTDRWGHEIDVGQEIPANGAIVTWRTDAPNLRGCENKVTFAVSDDGARTVLGTVVASLEKDFAAFKFEGGFSCKSSTSRFPCTQVSADKDPEGFELSATWNVGGR